MEYQVDDLPPEQDPFLIVQRCDCGRTHCEHVLLAIVRPVIRPLDLPVVNLPEFRPDELASVAYLPKEHIPALIEQLRMLGSE